MKAAEEVLLLAKARTLATTGMGRRVRVACDLSLRNVAESVGVAASTLWRWEQGQRRPRGAAASRWAHLVSELDREVA